MRASRLLSILLALSVRGRVSAAELARTLEVSVRTIYRDVDALGAAGVPVYATRGRGGGIALLDGYRTRLTGLTAHEAEAVFLTGLPSAASDLGLGSVLAATQLKLLAALPPQLRGRAARIRDRFLLDAPGWLGQTDAPPCLTDVADAVWNQRQLDVTYEKSNGSVTERSLAPLGLVLKAGTWYLVAAPTAADGHGPRTYRISRIRAAAVGPAGCPRPDDFDLERFWAAYQRDYAERVYRAQASVRLSPTGVDLLFLLGPVAARRARQTIGEPDPAGWRTATLPIESVHHGHHALLQLGEHVEVLEPAELRSLVAASAVALAGRYASPAPSGSAGR